MALTTDIEMATKIKNPIMAKKNLFLKHEERSARRMYSYGLAHWCNLSVKMIQTYLNSLGIGGQGFCDSIPKERLPVGDACVLGCVIQEGVEIVKITTLFFQKEGQLLGWIEGFVKGQSVDQEKIVVTSPIQFEKSINQIAKALKATIKAGHKKPRGYKHAT